MQMEDPINSRKNKIDANGPNNPAEVMVAPGFGDRVFGETAGMFRLLLSQVGQAGQLIRLSGQLPCTELLLFCFRKLLLRLVPLHPQSNPSL